MNANERNSLNLLLREKLAESPDAFVTSLANDAGGLIRDFIHREHPFYQYADIEDAWQEAFITLKKIAEDNKDIKNPLGMAFVVTQRKLADARRKQRRLLPLVDDSDILDTAAEPFEEWPEPLRIRVHELLGRMQNPERAILSLRFLLGWKLREIADALDMPVSTVGAKVASGLNQLRNSLKPYE